MFRLKHSDFYIKKSTTNTMIRRLMWLIVVSSHLGEITNLLWLIYIEHKEKENACARICVSVRERKRATRLQIKYIELHTALWARATFARRENAVAPITRDLDIKQRSRYSSRSDQSRCASGSEYMLFALSLSLCVANTRQMRVLLRVQESALLYC